MTEENEMTSILTDPVSEITCTKCGSALDVSAVQSFAQIACPNCDAPQTVPARLGPFLLLELLGTGGMGAVYHGVDESLGRHVAIKVMLQSASDNAESIEILRREARMAATLNHPNIVQIYSFGTEKGQAYIVMELVTGERLDEMIARGKPLDIGLMMRIGVGVAQGLKAAYNAGLVHGDIKPENILLDKEGTPKVVDFGLAGFADARASEDGIWGSPYYISPEKIRKQPTDARSDIYSLGASLYHALTSNPPFDGDTPVDVVKARLKKPPKPLTEAEVGPLAKVNTLLMRMLQQDPAMRHPTYDSVISDMKRVLQEVTKKGSGALALHSGKVLLTKKQKPAPGPAAQPAPSKTSRDTAKQVNRRPSTHVSQTPSSSSPGSPLAVIAIPIVITAIIIGAGWYLMSRRASAAKRDGLVQSVQTALDKIRGSGLQEIADAHSRKAPAQKAKEEYEKQLKLRAMALADEALTLLDSASKKSRQLRDAIDEAARIAQTAQSSQTVDEAQTHYNTMKAAMKRTGRLEAGIRSLIRRAASKLAKAEKAAAAI